MSMKSLQTTKVPTGRALSVSLVDTGPMSQVRRAQRAETIGAA